MKARTRKRIALKKTNEKSYLPGGFGVILEPEFPVAKKRKPSIPRKSVVKRQRKVATAARRQTL